MKLENTITIIAMVISILAMIVSFMSVITIKEAREKLDISKKVRIENQNKGYLYPFQHHD